MSSVVLSDSISLYIR